MPTLLLRQSDPALYDDATFQRKARPVVENDENVNNKTDGWITYDGVNGKPIPTKAATNHVTLTHCELIPSTTTTTTASNEGQDDSAVAYQLTWSDGHCATYPRAWIEQMVEQWQCRRQENDATATTADIASATSATTTTTRTNTTTNTLQDANDDRVFWTGWTGDTLRNNPEVHVTFEQLMSTNHNHSNTNTIMTRAMTALYKYGILLVKDTPTEDSVAMAALGAALGGGHYNKHYTNHPPNLTSLYSVYQQQQQPGTSGKSSEEGPLQLDHGTDGPMRTLYGTVWSTTSSSGGGDEDHADDDDDDDNQSDNNPDSLSQVDGASVADSAYGQDALPLHTDLTYWHNPPGLQIFGMVQAAQSGGESVYGDGFAAARTLQLEQPQQFDVLRQTVRTYRCMDQAATGGWHLQASGPVIVMSRRTGRIVGIRHNDLDRLPDWPPAVEASAGVEDSTTTSDFYQCLAEAHHAWDEILARDEMRLVIPLHPGETVVVANQRCMHGRYSFETTPTAPRIVRGCYMCQDELSSRFRMMGFYNLVD